jgi:hypothetical protein
LEICVVKVNKLLFTLCAIIHSSCHKRNIAIEPYFKDCDDMTLESIISDLKFEIEMEKLRSMAATYLQAKNDGCIDGLNPAIQIVEKHKIS